MNAQEARDLVYDADNVTDDAFQAGKHGLYPVDKALEDGPACREQPADSAIELGHDGVFNAIEPGRDVMAHVAKRTGDVMSP